MWRWLTILICRHALSKEPMPFHQLSCMHALSRAGLIWYHHRMASVLTGTIPLYLRSWNALLQGLLHLRRVPHCSCCIKQASHLLGLAGASFSALAIHLEAVLLGR